MESKLLQSNPNLNSTQFARRFPSKPGEDELSAPGLDDMAATSSVFAKLEKGVWRVHPTSVPVKAVAIWMYFCCLILFPLIIFFLTRDEPSSRNVGFGMCIAAAIVVVPMMLVLLDFINKSIGTEDYLRLDEQQQSIELPRLQTVFKVDQVEEVISIRCDDVTQTWILIDDSSEQTGWSAYLSFAICDSSHGMSRKLAKRIDRPCRTYQYTAKQLRQMRRDGI